MNILGSVMPSRTYKTPGTHRKCASPRLCLFLKKLSTFNRLQLHDFPPSSIYLDHGHPILMPKCINYIFHHLLFDALLSGALLTLEVPVPLRASQVLEIVNPPMDCAKRTIQSPHSQSPPLSGSQTLGHSMLALLTPGPGSRQPGLSPVSEPAEMTQTS